MAIIDSLYSYCTEWKTPPRIYQCCRNLLQYPYQQIFNSRYKDINLSHLLSSAFINQSDNKVIDQCNNTFDNTYNNTSSSNSRKTKKMTSNHSTSLMDCNHHHHHHRRHHHHHLHHHYQHHQLDSNDFPCNHTDNIQFALIKLKRTYNLLTFLINEKQLCTKHIELIKLFTKQLQTILKQLEEDNNEQLKHLIKFSIHVIIREIVTKGMKCIKDIIDCIECQDESIIDISMIKQYKHCNHYYSRKKYQGIELQNDNKIENTINRMIINLWSSLLSYPIDKEEEKTCLNSSFIEDSTICLLDSNSLLSSNSLSSPLFNSSSSLLSSSSSSSFSSSPSTSLSHLPSQLTESTYATISNLSSQLSNEQTVKDSNNKSTQTYHCQISNDNNNNKKLDSKHMRDKLFVYNHSNFNEEEYKKQNSTLKDYIEENKTPFCFVQNKPLIRNSSNTNYSHQHIRRYNQNETKNNKIHNLNEIYPHAVSRRPSVRDILRQQSNSFMQSQQYNIEKQQIYYPKQNKHLFFNELCNHLSTTTTTTTNTVTTTSDDDDNNSSNMLKSLEKSNLYTSSDYISCPQFNLCINRTDYLFSDHNLNMGVVPPPNLNPFTSS